MTMINSSFKKGKNKIIRSAKVIAAWIIIMVMLMDAPLSLYATVVQTIVVEQTEIATKEKGAYISDTEETEHPISDESGEADSSNITNEDNNAPEDIVDEENNVSEGSTLGAFEDGNNYEYAANSDLVSSGNDRFVYFNPGAGTLVGPFDIRHQIGTSGAATPDHLATWPFNPHAPAGQAFIGWDMAQQGTGPRATIETPFPNSGNTTVFAIYGVVVTFSSPLIALPPGFDPLVVQYNRNANDTICVTWPGDPNVGGETFIGWYTTAAPIDGVPCIRLDGDFIFTEHTTAHARWANVLLHTVTFYPDGGTLVGGQLNTRRAVDGSSIADSYRHNSDNPLIPLGVVRSAPSMDRPATNLHVAGWYMQPNGVGARFSNRGGNQAWNNATVVVTEPITVYPRWMHHVMFLVNGASAYWPGTPAMPETDVRRNVYHSERYFPPGGSLNANSINILGGIESCGEGRLPVNPQRPGFTFAGWYTQNGTTTNNWGLPFNPNATITPPSSGSVRIYARWVEAEGIPVTLNATEGEFTGAGAPDVRTFMVLTAGSFHSTFGGLVPMPVPVHPHGHRFMGWYRNVDIAPNATTNPRYVHTTLFDSPRTLYARWTPTVVVAFHPNGGTLQDVPANRPYRLLAQGATFADMHHIGVNHYPGANFAPGTTQNIGFWQTGEQFAVLNRPGFRFQGWNLQANPTDVPNPGVNIPGTIGLFTGGRITIQGTAFRFYENETLFAQWAPYVTFNNNLSSINPLDADVTRRIPVMFGRVFEDTLQHPNSVHNSATAASPMPLPTQFPTAENWATVFPDSIGANQMVPFRMHAERVFLGWYTAPRAGDPGDRRFEPDEIITEPITVFARWNTDVVFVSGVAPEEYILPENRNRPVPNGPMGNNWPPDPIGITKNFLGWYNESIGTGVRRDRNSNINAPEVITARWYVAAYFNPNNGGTVIRQPVPLDQHPNGWTVGPFYASTIIPLTNTIERVGWNFSTARGWRDAAGNRLSSTTVVTQNVTFYGNWDATITFNPDGGSIGGTLNNIGGVNGGSTSTVTRTLVDGGAIYATMYNNALLGLTGDNHEMPGIPVLPGYVFYYWEITGPPGNPQMGERFTGDTTITAGHTTVTARYRDVNLYVENHKREGMANANGGAMDRVTATTIRPTIHRAPNNSNTRFVEWRLYNTFTDEFMHVINPAGESITFDMPTTHSVLAVGIWEYSLELSANPTPGGSVAATVAGNQLTFTGSVAWVLQGSEVIVTATPNTPDWRLDRFDTSTYPIAPSVAPNPGPGNLSITIPTMTRAWSVVAQFAQEEFDLTVNNYPSDAADLVKDQSPETESDVVVGSILDWDEGTAYGWTFLGWVYCVLNLPSNWDDVPLTNRVDIYDYTTMPDSNLTVWALWGNSNGDIGNPNSFYLTINNVPIYSVADDVVVPIQGQILSGNRNANQVITLDSGERNLDTLDFLGWWIGTTGVPVNGDDITPLVGNPNFIAPSIPLPTFTMPARAETLTALWGRNNIVGAGLYQIAFHIYTGNQRLIDRFGYYGTPNADGILVINVPVTPGKPSFEWPNQNLLDVALSVGLVHGVGGTPGHAFWGWFRSETLNSSGRRGPTANAEIPNPTNPGLRRPLLTDRCEWLGDGGMDGGSQNRILDLLQNPSITQDQIDDLFGSNGTLDLFAIWSLWGDVNDDDVVNFTDLGILQAHLLFRYVDPNIIDLNRRAGDVFNNASLDWTDFNLLQSYLLTRDANPGQVILGILPPELRSVAFASFNARAVFEPMSIAVFADVDVAPLSGSSGITWQSPDVVVPAGQTYVDIYFTLDRPAGVARPMGIAGTSIQLLYPQGAFNPSNPWDQSFTFAEPVANLCECCFSTFDFNGQIGTQRPFLTGGTVVFGGGVTQLGDYAGELVIRARLMIPAGSPLNNPEIGYVDVTVQRGSFSAGTEIFPMEYSTVRIAREGLISLVLDEAEESEAAEDSEYPSRIGHPEEYDNPLSVVAFSQSGIAPTPQAELSQTEPPTDIVLDPEAAEEQFRASFMVGDDRGNFRPNSSITRAEAAAILVRTMDYFGIAPHAIPADAISNFTDINPNAWYAEYIAIAYSHELLQGFPDGTFNPNQPISREEFAAMLARTGLVSSGSNLNASDVSHVSDWATDYVYTAFASGLMQGDAIGTFRPREDITRAEAAATFARALDRGEISAESIANVNVRIFPDASYTGAWHYFYVVGATNSHWFVNGGGVDTWIRVTN